MMRHMFLAAALALGLASAAHAQTPTVKVTDAWARATTSQARAGGAFMTLTATGAPDRMLSATSPVAETVELHETVNEAGVMKMKPVPSLLVEPGKPAVLKPGSYHVMLIGLKRPLNRGETFPVTLTFDKSPPVTVTVTVQAAGAAGPGHSH